MFGGAIQEQIGNQTATNFNSRIDENRKMCQMSMASCHLLCSAKEIHSYRFGTKWGWVMMTTIVCRLHYLIEYESILPSKSTVPSPLLSASRTMASISFLLVVSPSSFSIACFSSSMVIVPSPSISNYRQMHSKLCFLFDFFFLKLKEKGTFLTSLNASFSSFSPIIPAVSASSFGAMSSTKSWKSTLPPTEKEVENKD